MFGSVTNMTNVEEVDEKRRQPCSLGPLVKFTSRLWQ